MFKKTFTLMVPVLMCAAQAHAQHDQIGESNTAKIGRFTCLVTTVKDPANTELKSLAILSQVGQKFYAEVYDDQNMGNGPIQQILLIQGLGIGAKTYHSNPSGNRDFVTFGENSKRFEITFNGAQGTSSISSQKGSSGWDAFQTKTLIQFTCASGI